MPDFGDLEVGKSLPPTPPRRRSDTSGELFICERCGALAEPVTRTPGNFALEVVLWLLCAVPGICYSIWRLASRRRDFCPKCDGGTMIPYNSPRGQMLFRQLHVEPKQGEHYGTGKGH